jgi:hypothetical protein
MQDVQVNKPGMKESDLIVSNHKMQLRQFLNFQL